MLDASRFLCFRTYLTAGHDVRRWFRNALLHPGDSWGNCSGNCLSSCSACSSTGSHRCGLPECMWDGREGSSRVCHADGFLRSLPDSWEVCPAGSSRDCLLDCLARSSENRSAGCLPSCLTESRENRGTDAAPTGGEEKKHQWPNGPVVERPGVRKPPAVSRRPLAVDRRPQAVGC